MERRSNRIEALALAIARSRQDDDGVAEDITQEPSAARLRQLSDEVSRIAATLARLSVGPDALIEKPQPPTGRSAERLAGNGPAGHPRATAARPLLRRGIVRRSGLGHAARPAAGRNRAASRARIVAVHRRGGSGDDGAALDQDDDRRRPVQAPRRSSRRPPGIRRIVRRRRAMRCAAISRR